MNAQRSFPHDLRSVRAARHFVAGALEPVEPLEDDQRERVVLLVSELASNAVQHGGTDFSVTVVSNGGNVRVEVTDHGVGDPTMQHQDLTRASGRGLRLVNDLADDWGVAPHDAGAKTVWFVV